MIIKHSVLSRVFALGMSLSVAVAPAHDLPGNPSDDAPVPASAQDWFRQGQKQVQANKFVNELPNIRQAKNVILFVGDGMGVSTVTAARILEGQLRGKRRRVQSPELRTIPVPGAVEDLPARTSRPPTPRPPPRRWSPASRRTTARSRSTRRSTATSPARPSSPPKSVQTILERAEATRPVDGRRSTARITHATPAVNYAHIGNRDWEADSNLPAGATVKDIARQLIEFPDGDGLEVVLGGGRTYFLPNTVADPEYPRRSGPPHRTAATCAGVGRKRGRSPPTSGTRRSSMPSIRRRPITCSACSSARTCSTRPIARNDRAPASRRWRR